MMMATNEADRKTTIEFKKKFMVEEVLIRQAMTTYTSKIHSNWGEAEFSSMKNGERADAVMAELKARILAHSPNNKDVRRKVLSLTDGCCAYCGQQLGSDFHIEHVVSKSAGGPDHLSNYVPACSTCNSRKSTMHVIDFIKKFGGHKSSVGGA